ncbi:MAG: hypothetical protein QUS66_09760 [Bacteroidota bacterium]|jgi:hypothetical protein|nr:hypothetical protein [Bacteroidota bacterium]
MKTIALTVLLLIHPVHVSLTGIDYDAVNRVWSVFVKVWSDDLEADMNLGLANGRQITGTADERYLMYLSDRVVVMEDGEPLRMELVSAGVDGLEHRFNLQAKGKKAVRNVTVLNRIMTRLYEDQANMLLFSYGSTEEGYRFTVTDTMKSYQVKRKGER